MQIQPSYQAETRIFFEGDRLNVVEMEEVLVNPGIGLEDQVQLVVSQSVLAGVVEDLRLMARPEFNARLAEELERGAEDDGVISWATAKLDEWRALLADWRAADGGPTPDADQSGPSSPAMSDAVGALREKLSVRAVSPSVLSIAVESPDPQLSAAIANAVAERFIDGQLEARVEAMRSATDWLSERTVELEARVRDAEAKVEEARAELTREAGQGTRLTQAQLTSLNEALSAQQTRIPALEARYEGARAVLERGDYESLSDFRDSARLRTLRERRAELALQRRSLSESVSETHPAMRALTTQTAEVDEAMREEAHRITASIGNELQAARSAASELTTSMRALESKSLEQARAELRVRQLEREAEANRILYESFLGRLQEAAEQQKLQSSDARIISRAEPPSSPTGGKKKIIVAGSGAAGGTLGILLAFLLEFLNTRFRDPRELEQATGYPVLGALPSLRRMGRHRNILEVIGTERGRLLNEAIRDLRTSILYTNIDKPPKVVVFTSAAPGDGKSTLSLLTSVANQEMGKRTILVECDLRRPSLMRSFRTNAKSQGLISTLTGEATLDDAIFVEEKTGLHLLAIPQRESMSTFRNPADILSSQRFKTLVDELRSRYDFVAVDAPPVLAAPDTRVISPLADALVFVVRWKTTPRAAVDESMKQLHRINAPIIGLCMNAIDERKARRFANQHYGFYPGEYRHGYL